MKYSSSEDKDQELLKKKAQALFENGSKLKDIAQELNIKLPTLATWKRRGGWVSQSQANIKLVQNLNNRIIDLIARDGKTVGELKELDLLLKVHLKIEPLNKPKKDEKDKAIKNPLSKEQIKKICEGFFAHLFDYQKKWLEYGNKFKTRIILKSRQIGATYFFSFEAIADALTSGRDQIFISASKKQSLVFRDYIVKYVFDTTGVILKGETIILPNGAKLIFLGTNAKTAQSYHGNVYIDEFFWIQNFNELQKVAKAMASQKKYRVTFFSTPSIKSHEAYPLWSGEKYNKDLAVEEQKDFNLSLAKNEDGYVGADGVWRNIVTIYNAEKNGCNLFDIEQLKKEYSPLEFSQLFLCDFADESGSVFNFDLLIKGAVDTYTKWKDFKPFQSKPFNKKVWLGCDPASSSDNSCICIIAPPTNEYKKFRLLQYEKFNNLDFSTLANKIKEFCNIYNVEKITIDKTGLGVGVFELVQQFRPDCVGLSYTMELKQKLVLKAYDTFLKNRFEFDNSEREFISNFIQIRKTITKGGGSVTFTSGRNKENSHADLAWAVMNVLLLEPLNNEHFHKSIIELN